MFGSYSYGASEYGSAGDSTVYIPIEDAFGVTDSMELTVETEILLSDGAGVTDHLHIQTGNYALFINGVDMTLRTIFGSVKFKKNINQLGGILNLSLRKYGAFTYTPAENDQVEFFDPNGVIIFTGVLTRTSKTLEGVGVLRYDLEFSGWAFIFQSRRVVERYESTTGAAVLADLITKYAPGFTSVHVDAPFEIVSIVFNRVTLTEAIEKLAKYANYSWYVDNDKDLHFFPRYGEAATMDITDTSANYIYDSLEVEDDFTQIRNRVFVRGGEVEGTTRTETYVADGEQTTFPLASKFSSLPVVTVDATPVTVGVDGLDEEDDFDCFWNYQSKSLRFKDDTKPAVSEVVTITAKPLYRLILQAEDAASISRLGGDPVGVREYVIMDDSLKSRQEAEDRALAELEAYASKLVDGRYQTNSPGFEPGQILQINAPSREIAGDFIIQSVSFQLISRQMALFTVDIATLRTIAILDILIGQIRNQDRGFDDNDDEILEKTYFINESLLIAETVDRDLDTPIPENLEVTEEVARNDDGPIFVYAPYVPSGTSDPKVKSIYGKAKYM